MIIKILVENTSLDKEFHTEHGLSLYIETKNHRLLFDLGQGQLFFENAQKLGVNLSKIDTVIISHGHYDHGGGLPLFLQLNTHAKIYIQKSAFVSHFSKRINGELVDIGLKPLDYKHSQLVFLEGNDVIDEELTIISEIKGNKFKPIINQSLLTMENFHLIEDSFIHEQSLIITEDQVSLLIAGCAHRGIVNILNESQKYKTITHVLGGFHLSSKYQEESKENIQALGKALSNTDLNFYTGHCTGVDPYNILKAIMGDKIQEIHTGNEFVIGKVK